MNIEKLKAQRQRYYKKNKERLIKASNAWRLKNKEYMRQYHREREQRLRRTFDGKVGFMFKDIKGRLRNKATYKNRKLNFNLTQFRKFILNDQNYQRLFKEWQASGFLFSLCPSIDRIDNDGDYSLDNIQVITKSSNSHKWNQ